MASPEMQETLLRTVTIIVAALIASFGWALPIWALMRRFRDVYYKIPGAEKQDGPKKIDPNVESLTIWLGIFERIVYAVSWIYNHPETIFVILAIKTTPTLKGWSEPEREVGRSQFNLWLIGNFLSVGGAVITAEVARFLLAIWNLY